MSIKLKTIVGPILSKGSLTTYCEYNARNISASSVMLAVFLTLSRKHSNRRSEDSNYTFG